jgi:nitroreductase
VFDETLDQAWNLRYGHDAPSGAPDIASFLRHRSVRKYKEEDIPLATVQALVGAAQSAATSSNLQLWSIISVRDRQRRERLATMCADYEQVRTCPWFFAFLADHYRLRRAAEAVGEDAAGLDYVEFYTMAVIDAALAAERMVCAAESIGLGICYIGALRNDVRGVQEVLDLPPGVFGVFGLCTGWPAEPLTAEIKPRLSQPSIWFEEHYQRDVSVADYDERMKAFYEAQHMKGEVTWSMRSARRVDGAHMTGRDVLKPWLESRGFNLR